MERPTIGTQFWLDEHRTDFVTEIEAEEVNGVYFVRGIDRDISAIAYNEVTGRWQDVTLFDD